jgi:hypothetical protein
VNKELTTHEIPLAIPRWRGLSRSAARLFGIWLVLRLLMSLWAALVSPLRPFAERERSIALWPPSWPLGAWLERALLAPWERRDAIHFVRIVAEGYRADDGSAQFHPLLMWLAMPIYALTAQPLLALMLVSGAASLMLLFVFERLARLDLPPADARIATLLLVCAPPAFILFAPYTEALFLLWSALCLLWARQRAWWRAGLAGGLAVLTRQQGIFLLLPLAWELWAAARPNTKDQGPKAGTQSERRVAWHDWLALGMIPAGLLTWLVYRAALGDLRASFGDPQALIYSLLISPSSAKIVPVQAFLPPWQTLGLALGKLVRAPEYSLVIDLALAAVFVGLLALAWRHMRASYRIYAVTITLVSFAYYTGPHYPYMGLPRHLLLAFPVFIGLAQRLRRRWAQQLVFTSGVLGMLFLLLQYVIHGWVP